MIAIPKSFALLSQRSVDHFFHSCLCIADTWHTLLVNDLGKRGLLTLSSPFFLCLSVSCLCPYSPPYSPYVIIFPLLRYYFSSSGSLELLALVDDNTPIPGKGKLRFVNLQDKVEGSFRTLPEQSRERDMMSIRLLVSGIMTDTTSESNRSRNG